MFRFVTKKEYWDIVDSNILDRIKTKPNYLWDLKSILKAIKTKPNPTWHLKSIQDAIAFSYLYKYSDKCIAEIGGGDSRVLPTLARKNICFNIEEFKGVGGGPKNEIRVKGITNILESVGNFPDSIKDEQFDAIFSISVVEHIPNKMLSDFFKDCHRILKPSGLMIHLIDVYLEDAAGDNSNVSRRVCNYGSFLNSKLFLPLEQPTITAEKDVYFLTSFATNPDNMMEEWNRLVPQLKNKRQISQSCTLLMVGRKAGMEELRNS